MKGLDSYQSGTKGTWRGWQWNQISKRLCGGRKLGPAAVRDVLSKKTVLYLVGPDDFDREAAIKRGFRNENLIAIDINNENIARVRTSGGIGLQGSLQQIILEWPRHQQIDAVIFDSCAGVNADFGYMILALAECPAMTADSVVSINLLRGRDTAAITEILGTTNRSAHAVAWIAALAARKLCTWNNVTQASDEGSRYFDWAWDWMAHSGYSYRSGTQYFDSVVFRWLFDPPSSDCNCNECRRKELLGSLSPRLKVGHSRTRAKLAALRAVRTAKLKKSGAA